MEELDDWLLGCFSNPLRYIFHFWLIVLAIRSGIFRQTKGRLSGGGGGEGGGGEAWECLCIIPQEEPPVAERCIVQPKENPAIT